jgi:hypothetical protein
VREKKNLNPSSKALLDVQLDLRKRKFMKSSSKWLSHLQWILERETFKNFVQADAFCPERIEDGESNPERK